MFGIFQQFAISVASSLSSQSHFLQNSMFRQSLMPLRHSITCLFDFIQFQSFFSSLFIQVMYMLRSKRVICLIMSNGFVLQSLRKTISALMMQKYIILDISWYIIKNFQPGLSSLLHSIHHSSSTGGGQMSHSSSARSSLQHSSVLHSQSRAHLV